MQRFHALVAAGPRGSAVIVVPFDPDEAWGAKAEHPVGGTIDGSARGEAATAGAPRLPEVESIVSFPAVVNDEAACARTLRPLRSVSPVIVDPGPVTGSEDVGLLATAAGAPCVYWLLGGADPSGFDGATTIDEVAARSRDLPSNHSPMFAPVIEPTLSTGIGALTAAARIWLQQ